MEDGEVFSRIIELFHFVSMMLSCRFLLLSDPYQLMCYPIIFKYETFITIETCHFDGVIVFFNLDDTFSMNYLAWR